ncbi:MAG TPA: hypothetical protein VFL86_09710 [Burkholderiaceae bacterium]|nr:hypothetical protein [Burkholderiaceae bacterium]
MTPSLRARILALVVPAMAAAAAQAADPPLRLQVSPTQVLAPVNPEVLRGYNFGNWMQVAEFRELLQPVRPYSFRFPGGNVGDEFDMNEDRLKVLKPSVDLMGGPEVFFHTRVFQSRPNEPPARNTPEDAAASVRMARSLGLRVRYWEIGNEPDLFAVTRGDKSWTAERYCGVFRAQAKAIKQADPQALVAGPAVSGAVPGREQFMASFVKECGDVVDMLTYHIYPTDGSTDEAQALDTAADGDEIIRRYRALWADPTQNPKGHQRKIKYGVTEYGLSWRSDKPHLLSDFPGAMWAAEMALRLNRNGVDLAHYFAFQGTSHHGLIDDAGVPRPSFYGFRMLAGLQGQWVAAQSGDADLWTHAALDGNQLSVVLINKGKAAKTVSTALPQWRFAGGDYFDAKIVDEEAPLATFSPEAASVVLPGYSFTRLTFERR